MYQDLARVVTYTKKGTKSRSNHTTREHPHQCGCSLLRFIDVTNCRATHNQERCPLEGSENPEDEVGRKIGRHCCRNGESKEQDSANDENLLEEQ